MASLALLITFLSNAAEEAVNSARFVRLLTGFRLQQIMYVIQSVRLIGDSRLETFQPFQLRWRKTSIDASKYFLEIRFLRMGNLMQRPYIIICYLCNIWSCGSFRTSLSPWSMSWCVRLLSYRVLRQLKAPKIVFRLLKSVLVSKIDKGTPGGAAFDPEYHRTNNGTRHFR